MYANLNDAATTVSTTKDSVVIKKYIDGYEGGRTLDPAALPASTTVIQAGHVIIIETSTGVFKPMPTTGDPASAYSTLPTGHTYAGILRSSVTRAKPFAAIMTNGTVNPNAGPHAMTSILAAVKTALTQIEFRAD